MEVAKANLPTEHASEPKEEAYQPLALEMGPEQTKKAAPGSKQKATITFAVPDSIDRNCSQNSWYCTTYNEALSQPAATLSHKQRMLWLQQRRARGLWAQCDACQRWRHLPHVLDSHELPEKWYCSMNTDPNMADCSVPEARLRVGEEEDLIHNEYSAGSLVWARAAGWPAWPAMVDDDPDTEQFYWLDGFSDIPTHYNVVFFDTDTTRAWISPENMKPYHSGKKCVIKDNKFKKRIETAMKQANEASKLPLEARLAKYSFIARYKGPVRSPKKVDRKTLERYQKKLQRKFNVAFPIESSSESDDDIASNAHKSSKSANVNVALNKTNEPEKEIADDVLKRKNVTIVGTPKRTKTITKRNLLKESIENEKDFDESLEEVAKAAKQNFDEFETMINSTIVKEPDSMTVQICDSQVSKLASVVDTDANDISLKTRPNTETATSATGDDANSRPLSPKSDDFEF